MQYSPQFSSNTNIAPVSLGALGEREKESEEHQPWVFRKKKSLHGVGRDHGFCLVLLTGSMGTAGPHCPCPSPPPHKVHRRLLFFYNTLGVQRLQQKTAALFFGAPLLPPACLAFGVLQLVDFHFTPGMLPTVFHNFYYFISDLFTCLLSNEIKCILSVYILTDQKGSSLRF